MFLKSLHISGFKSFADKTALEFHPGVTAIVGPNGCGKSNVVDAIRWVLGETSAKALRGGEMADVIFNGTDKRKQLGLAEVMLTLGDCEDTLGTDFNEICVGRRVYRDGRSEYLINKKACRLKDINELFMDTGIGRSSYSIMEQGKIDLLLSSKPEDRRQVFEEAAGITKFKQQKREALRKLEYTEANLLRITDIIEEQRRQMGSLQRQASKARRYANLLEQVKILDTHLSHRQFEVLGAEYEELKTSINSLRISQEELQVKVEDGQRNVSVARTELQQLEHRIAEQRHREIEQQNRIHSAKNRIEFNEERQRELGSLIERNESDIRGARERLESQEAELATTEENLSAIREKVQQQEDEMREFERNTGSIRRRRAAMESGLSEMRNTQAANKSLVATLTAQLESGRAQLAASETRLTQISEEYDRLVEDRDARQTEEAAMEIRQSEHESQAEELRRELNQLEECYRVAKSELAGVAEEETKLSRECTQTKTRLETLKQMAASGEGFESGTKEVLKGLDDPDRFQGALKGVVANLIEVEEDFVPAIEAALGHSLQAVIVTQADEAQAMLSSLEDGERGQASLIPEDLLQAQPKPGKAPEESLGWAIDHLKADSEVKPVIQQLLAGVLVVEDLKVALDLHGKDGLTLVTRKGEVLTSQGVLTGGSRKKSGSSALDRQREIRGLEKQAKALETKLGAVETRRMELEQSAQEAREELELQKERLQQNKVERSTVEGQLNLVRREIHQFESKLQSSEREKEDHLQRQEIGEEKQTALGERKQSILAELQQLGDDLREMEAGLEKIQIQETEANNKLNELRTVLAVERRTQEALEHQREPLVRRIRELKEDLQQREGEIETYQERIANAKTETERLRIDIRENERGLEATQTERQQLETNRAEQAAEIERGEAEVARMRQEVTRMNDQRGKEEIRSTQLELRMENLTSSIQERYQVDLTTFRPDSHALLAAIEEQRKSFERTMKRRGEEVDAEVADEEAAEEEDEEFRDESEPDWDFVESIIGEQKRKLDSMGHVNLDAIAEYEELEERFNLMQEQHDDLVKSKDDLLKVIQKINRTTRSMFAETFEQVRQNFRSMFSELFGQGAQANLVLLDDEDPLECGIEIIAKPPGKRLQSITLLSGGERSMTAVALLFAIYMVKPSPFCVLDELDAPLDEANIGRFTRVLDRFSSESQFIIVTHSKRTMSRADVIYGVSMEEYGVSKTLGMKFSSGGLGSNGNGSSSGSVASSSNGGEGASAVAPPKKKRPKSRAVSPKAGSGSSAQA